MAINLNNNNNLQQNPNGQPSNAAGQNLTPQGQQQPQFKPQTSGFTNIQSVLGANANNKLGSTIGQGVQSLANKTSTATGNAQNQFAQQIGQANQDIKAGQGVNQNLSALDFSKTPDDTSQTSQAIQDVAGNQGNVQALQNLRTGYQGPQGLAGSQQLQSQSQDLSQLGQGLLTQGGKQAALQRYVGTGPNYTQGQQKLDTLLLGQNQQPLQQARRSALSTATGTNQAIQQANQLGGYTGQQYGAVGSQVGNTLQGLEGGLGNALNTRAQNYTKASADAATGLQGRINSGNLTQDDYNQLSQALKGQTNTQGLKASDIASFVGANTNYNQSNVASKQDLAARNALAQLSGQTNPNAALNLDAAQVGTAEQGAALNSKGLYGAQQANQQFLAQHQGDVANLSQGLGYQTPTENNFTYDKLKAANSAIQGVLNKYGPSGINEADFLAHPDQPQYAGIQQEMEAAIASTSPYQNDQGFQNYAGTGGSAQFGGGSGWNSGGAGAADKLSYLQPYLERLAQGRQSQAQFEKNYLPGKTLEDMMNPALREQMPTVKG